MSNICTKAGEVCNRGIGLMRGGKLNCHIFGGIGCLFVASLVSVTITRYCEFGDNKNLMHVLDDARNIF